MGLELSGSFFTDIFLLLGLLFLPLPTTPYILYLFSTNSILEAGIVFFLATTLRDFITYYLGYFSKNIKFKKLFYSFNFVQTNISDKFSERIRKVTEFSKDKLQKATIKDVVVARWLGVHPIIVAFGLGRLLSRINLFFIPNSFYVLIDVTFYWILFGSGKLILTYFFPGLVFDEFLRIEYLYPFSIFMIFIFYVIYGYKKWR